MDAIWLPGTLCDFRVFGDLPQLLNGSAIHPKLWNYSDTAAAATAILEIAPQSFVSVGFSLGGFVALEILRRAPERLQGVVLISGNAHPDRPENAATRREEVQFTRAHGMAKLVERSWPLAVGPASQSNALLRSLLVDMAETVGSDGLARQAEMNITRPDFRDVVAHSSIPMLVVTGAEDKLCPRDRYETAAAGPAAMLRVVPAAGHFVPVEAPRAVVEWVAPFLRELQP